MVSMDRLLVGGALIAALLFGVLIGYGIGSSSKVVVITETTTLTTAYMVTVETRVTTVLTATTNSTVTQSLGQIQLFG